MVASSPITNQISSIFLDTAPFIYFVEKNEHYFEKAYSIFSAIDEGAFTSYSSVITLVEVLIVPVRNNNKKLQKAYEQILLNGRNFKLLSITHEIALTGASLRANYNLRMADALQIASAISADCDTFLTNDKALKRINEIQVLTLDDLADTPE